MRRTSLCIELLPKKISKAKATRNFLNSLDEASEANAKVRDLDIILSKLSTYKPDLSMEERISGIKETRESQLDRKSTRLNSSHSQISYAVFCLKKKNINLLPSIYAT